MSNGWLVLSVCTRTEAFFAALEQREAVAHVAGLLRREHAVAEQTDRLGEGRIGQAHRYSLIWLCRSPCNDVLAVRSSRSRSYSGRPSRPARRMRATVMPLVASTG